MGERRPKERRSKGYDTRYGDLWWAKGLVLDKVTMVVGGNGGSKLGQCVMSCFFG